MRFEAQTKVLQKSLGSICPPELLQVLDLEVFYGPSPWSPEPAVLCQLEIGTADLPSASALEKAVRAFFDDELQSVAARPKSKPGLQPIAEVAARLAGDLLASGMKMPVGFGARSEEPGRIIFWTDYVVLSPAVQAIKIAAIALGAALAGKSPTAGLFGRAMAEFDRLCAGTRPNSESRVLLAGAKAHNIPILQMCDYSSLWQFGWGERSERFWVSSSNGDGVVGGFISRFKAAQKSLFVSLGIPTPKWRLLNAGSDLNDAVADIGFPCVVKPADSGGGKGVNAQIHDIGTLRQAVAAASKFSSQLLMEEYQPGEDYRLMVIDGKMVMTIRRSPSIVVGDGRSSVEELLAALNESRRDAKRAGYLKKVPQDDGVRLALADQGLALTSVPNKGQVVRLRTNANHATGGVCEDVTDRTHEQTKRYAEQLALALGFRVLGVDYITPDISKSHEEVGGAFLEVNATPGLEVLLTNGASAESIGALVLGPKPGRIPVCLLLAADETLDASGSRLRETLKDGAGAASADWAQLGSLPLPQSALRPVDRARSLLRYPSLKSLVILWTPEDLCRFGLPVDAVDLAVVVGEPPTDEWMKVLDRHSNQMVKAAAIAEGVNLISQWGRDEAQAR